MVPVPGADRVKRLALLGSTGSVGEQSLAVAAAFPDRYRAVALAAGLHVHDAASGEWNREVITRAMPGMPVVMIEWARRRQGIVLPQGNPAGITGVRDLAGRKVIPRQANAGSQVLFEQLLDKLRLLFDFLAAMIEFLLLLIQHSSLFVH